MSSFRARRSLRYVARPKRNAERDVRAGTSNVAANTQQIAYTFGATQAGTIKSIKLDIGSGGGLSNDTIVPYALVVVREGYNANLLVYPALTDDLYNPTMDVLISGILTDGSFEDHKWNKIGRKLKAGDRICLIVYNTSGGTATDIAFELSFSFMS